MQALYTGRSNCSTTGGIVQTRRRFVPAADCFNQTFPCLGGPFLAERRCVALPSFSPQFSAIATPPGKDDFDESALGPAFVRRTRCDGNSTDSDAFLADRCVFWAPARQALLSLSRQKDRIAVALFADAGALCGAETEIAALRFSVARGACDADAAWRYDWVGALPPLGPETESAPPEPPRDSSVSGALVGGIAAGTVAFIVLVVVAFMVLRRHFAKTTKNGGGDLMLQPPSSSSASASTMHMNASSISSSSAPPSFTATPHPRTNSSDATSTLRDGRTVSVTATTTTNNNTNSVTATDEKSKAAYSDASNLFHDIIALTDNHHYPHRTTAPNTDFVNEKLLFHQLNTATDSTTIASTTIADSNNSTHTSSSYDQKTKNGDGLFLFDAINSAATTQYPTKSGNNDEKNKRLFDGISQVVDQATKRKKDDDDGRGNAVPKETTTTTKVLFGPLNDMIDGVRHTDNNQLFGPVSDLLTTTENEKKKSTFREERMFDAMGDLAAGNHEDEPTKDNSTAPVAAPLDPPLHMNNETSSLVSWTIQDVAEWVLMNGGSDVEAANVHAHRIDGEVIMAVSINELIQAITHGSPRRNPEELREALLRLKDSQLPSYDQFLQSS